MSQAAAETEEGVAFAFETDEAGEEEEREEEGGVNEDGRWIVYVTASSAIDNWPIGIPPILLSPAPPAEDVQG